MKPWMDDKEIRFIESFLDSDKIMLEWGSGGSTLYFPNFVKKYYSIEHDKEWYNKIKIDNNLPNNVNIFNVPSDLERTIPTKREQFKTYIEYVKKINIKFDLVFIDGRARNFCAEEVIPYLKSDSIVFIHDFWKREYYHNVFEWYDEVDSIKDTKQTIVALKLKNNNKDIINIS